MGYIELASPDSYRQIIRKPKPSPTILTGNSLSIPDVVAVAQHGIHASLRPSKDAFEHGNDSAQLLQEELDKGHYIYGKPPPQCL